MKRLFLLGVLLLFPACGKSLEKQVQQQVRTLGNARLEKDLVEVGEVRASGDQAIAEVTIHTAAKMRREGDDWVLDEIRLGDRQWERIDHILEALNLKRIRETEQKMERIRESIVQYESQRGAVPQVPDFEDLIDVLTPQFLSEVIRNDAWWTPFAYKYSGASDFELRSAGPDQILRTNDDLVVRRN